MFCKNCGSELQTSARFCQSCGTPVEIPAGKRKEEQQAQRAPKVRKQRTVAVLLALTVAVAALAASGVWFFFFRPGGQIERSFLGKMFAMPWAEIAGKSERDLKYMLEDEGIFVQRTKGSEWSGWRLAAEDAGRFMGGDALYELAFDEGAYTQNFVLLYETRQDYGDSYERIARYLEKNLVRNSVPIREFKSPETLPAANLAARSSLSAAKEVTLYLLDKSTEAEDIERYVELYIEDAKQRGRELSAEEERKFRESAAEGAIYKTVCLSRIAAEQLPFLAGVFPFDSDSCSGYAPNACMISVSYALDTEQTYDRLLASVGYDAASGGEIDMDAFRESLDSDLRQSVRAAVDAGEGSESSAETRAYAGVYLMEKYSLDMDTGKYVDGMDKNIWYIVNYGYDKDRGKKVDLSAYRDSVQVYCAQEYDYDMRTGEQFKSELDKALCLAEWDYHYDTGESFGSYAFKKLWFLLRFGYELESGTIQAKYADRKLDKETVQELANALLAYQKYVDEMGEDFDSMIWYLDRAHWGMAYIDEDDIPELFWHDLYSYSGVYAILRYREGEVLGAPYDVEGSVYYIEKRNFIYASGGWMDYYPEEYLSLVDGELCKVADAAKEDVWDFEKGEFMGTKYFWGGVECSEAQYQDEHERFRVSRVGADAVWKELCDYFYFRDFSSDVYEPEPEGYIGTKYIGNGRPDVLVLYDALCSEEE